MLDVVLPAAGHVIEELRSHEIVFAKDQPEYEPLRALRSTDTVGAVLTRWALTPEQREALAAGADIYLELLTFRQPLQPIAMYIGTNPDPDFFRERYGL